MLKAYDPAGVTLIIGGNIISGVGPGQFVSASRETDDFTDESGADGEVAFVDTNDTRGSVTITLMQTSLSNDVLTGFVAAKSIVPLLFKDASGNLLVSSQKGRILRPADSNRGKEIETVEWVYRSPHLTMFVGGNPVAG